jgi:hypothetical protein
MAADSTAEQAPKQEIERRKRLALGLAFVT